MFRYVVAMLCGASLAGSVYMAGWKSACCVTTGETTHNEMGMMEGGEMPMMDMTGKVDVMNTKCVVAGEDVGASKYMVEYQGKVYHLCCGDCVAMFKKEPEKYVKALEAEPAKFGVKAKG